MANAPPSRCLRYSSARPSAATRLCIRRRSTFAPPPPSAHRMGRLDGFKGDEYIRIFRKIRTKSAEIRTSPDANLSKNSKPLSPSSRPRTLCQWRGRGKADGVRFHLGASASPFAAKSIHSRRRQPAGRTANDVDSSAIATENRAGKTRNARISVKSRIQSTKDPALRRTSEPASADTHPRHLFTTTPSLNSMKVVSVFSFELLPPKIRKIAPLLSVCSV